MIIIFTYNRPKMLDRLLRELSGDIVIIDDGSDYPAAYYSEYDYRRFEHIGKPGFWKQWQRAFDICRNSSDDHFMFMPDDWYGFDIDRMEWVHSKLDVYAFNFANKGAKKSWTDFENRRVRLSGYECWQTGFVDCCFSTSRKTLDKLEWTMRPIDPKRQNNRSSGVGKQLSQRFLREGVPMFKPLTSLCREDPHESLMNPEERKLHPRPML